jgi:hypothetical protein
MIRFALIGALFTLTACNQPTQPQEQVEQRAKIICYGGVEYIYLRYDRGVALTPHYKPDGTLVPCGED